MVELNEKLTPIPLSEEWLKKFGGRIIDEGEYHKDWRVGKIMVRYKKDIEKFLIGCWNESEDNCFVVYLDYVHTLQNAYALTGEELTIKETV